MLKLSKDVEKTHEEINSIEQAFSNWGLVATKGF